MRKNTGLASPIPLRSSPLARNHKSPFSSPWQTPRSKDQSQMPLRAISRHQPPNFYLRARGKRDMAGNDWSEFLDRCILMSHWLNSPLWLRRTWSVDLIFCYCHVRSISFRQILLRQSCSFANNFRFSAPPPPPKKKKKKKKQQQSST